MLLKSIQIKLEHEKNKNKDNCEKYEKIKIDLKKVEILVNSHNFDFKQQRAQMQKITSEYEFFNKHKLQVK